MLATDGGEKREGIRLCGGRCGDTQFSSVGLCARRLLGVPCLFLSDLTLASVVCLFFRFFFVGESAQHG